MTSIPTTSILVNRASKYKLNNDKLIPVIGYGLYLVPKGDAARLTYEALKAGYRHVDTAEYYNNAVEAAQGVASFLNDHPEVERGDIWFTTKLTNEQQGYEATVAALEKIGKELKPYIKYVDLVLLHSPLTSKEKRLGSWKALQEHTVDNDALWVKSIGVSNFGVDHLKELFEAEHFYIKPVLNQLELHPWLPRVELRQFLVKHDILPEAYSPLTQGYKLDDPELVSLAEKYKVNKVEILLRWAFLQGFIVLVKSNKPERIAQNIDVLPVDTYGKIDLELEILDALDKPESNEVLTWGNVDPTLFKDT
ncbi:uncharacterized protein KQ657_004777 [Scheffersomyces spartinae]|uniref:2-dehydropantolactone reductase n=1 Tax=Scheffersomyces spartinae TaxID=45513 RepID=A0A9P8AIQ5_9ASCO|nr:uncharacterized protein KQ657_004777 [Scheffersomyces spartinae]KAG7194069.1 hypothetical protein KQ657_004777 [Scheffersomyces spartinae]